MSGGSGRLQPIEDEVEDDIDDMPPLESVPSTPLPHHEGAGGAGGGGGGGGIDGGGYQLRRRRRRRSIDEDIDGVRRTSGNAISDSVAAAAAADGGEEDEVEVFGDGVAGLTRMARLSRVDSFASTAELIPPSEEGSPSRPGGGG